MRERVQVVFVEDDRPVRNTLTEALELSGMDVRACENAECEIWRGVSKLFFSLGARARVEPILVWRSPGLDR